MSNGCPTRAGIGSADLRQQVVGVGDFSRNGTDDIRFRKHNSCQQGMFAMDNNQATWTVIGWVDLA